MKFISQWKNIIAIYAVYCRPFHSLLDCQYCFCFQSANRDVVLAYYVISILYMHDAAGEPGFTAVWILNKHSHHTGCYAYDVRRRYYRCMYHNRPVGADVVTTRVVTPSRCLTSSQRLVRTYSMSMWLVTQYSWLWRKKVSYSSRHICHTFCSSRICFATRNEKYLRYGDRKQGVSQNSTY